MELTEAASNPTSDITLIALLQMLICVSPVNIPSLFEENVPQEAGCTCKIGHRVGQNRIHVQYWTYVEASNFNTYQRVKMTVPMLEKFD